jgi:hypothetical protein
LTADRFGRSLRDLVTALDELSAWGIDFVSYSDSNIDTTTPTGKLVFHVIGAVATHGEGHQDPGDSDRSRGDHRPPPGPVGQSNKSASGHIKRMMAQLEMRPIRTVALIRVLLFLSPWTNYVLGATGLSFRHYLFGSIAGLTLPMLGATVLFYLIL